MVRQGVQDEGAELILILLPEQAAKKKGNQDHDRVDAFWTLRPRIQGRKAPFQDRNGGLTWESREGT